MRGLPEYLTILPKSPGEMIRPALSIDPPEPGIVEMSLTGSAGLAWFKTLKNSMRNSNLLCSAKLHDFEAARSRLLCPGPRNELRRTLPRSVPPFTAVAVPPELGIRPPGGTVASIKAKGLK